MQLITVSEDPLSRIVQAARTADRQFQVSVADETVSVCSNVMDAGRICEFVFGPQANVSSNRSKVLNNDIWTIAALASDVVYDLCLLAGLQCNHRVTEPQPAHYWRDDHEAESISRSSKLTVIRHCKPFSGLTFFVPAQKLVLYVWKESERIYIPHFEHLITYTLRAPCWTKGFLDVHAAVVLYRNRGLILSGRKRAGKTSLAMHLLRRGGFLLGSDMGELYASGPSLRARAMPHICRITRETVWDNPLLDGAIGSSFETNEDYMNGPVFSGGKFELYASALDRVFGRPVHIDSMRVSALIFLRFSLGATHHRITHLAPVAGLQRLLTGIETDRPAADWLPYPEVTRRKEIEEEAKRSIGATIINAFELEFGRSDSLDWNEIDGFIDSL